MTGLNEIPGAAKLGKIYHFVWSRGNHNTALVTRGERDGSDLSGDMKRLKTGEIVLIRGL